MNVVSNDKYTNIYFDSNLIMHAPRFINLTNKEAKKLYFALKTHFEKEAEDERE